MNFAKISWVLYNLIKKNSIWTWRIEQQNVYVLQVVKKTFTTVLVLRIPNDEKSFKLSIDISKFATGTVLS